MSEFIKITIPPDEWTLISEVSTEFQIIGRQHIYYTESETLPVGNENSANYKIAAPRYLHRFNKKANTNLYGYSIRVAAVITMGANDDSVYTADQTTEIVDLRLSKGIDSFTLVGSYNIDDTQIVITCATPPQVGDLVCLKEIDAFYQGEIVAVAGTNPYTIDLDTPLDYDFTPAGSCTLRDDNMAVDGSITPQEFVLSPVNLRVGHKWDITRILFTIVDEAQMDDGLFGGIPALTKGVVLRHKNHTTKNIFNVKTNGDFALRTYDAVYSPKAPAGQYGFRVRRTFAGHEKNGVAIRLESLATNSDLVEIIIQDDLTDLTSFRAVMQGHVVLD